MLVDSSLVQFLVLVKELLCKSYFSALNIENINSLSAYTQ